MTPVTDPDISAFLAEGFNTGKESAKGRALARDPRATPSCRKIRQAQCRSR
jgi:hypothetical protein